MITLQPVFIMQQQPVKGAFIQQQFWYSPQYFNVLNI